MRKLFAVQLLILAVAFCAGCPRKPEGVPRALPVSVEEVWSLFEQGAVVIDVRSPEEFAGEPAAIEGAINIPYDDISTRMVELDSESTYLVVCRTGSSSPKAADFMVRNGIGKVYFLKGGMVAYRKKYPAEAPEE